MGNELNCVFTLTYGVSTPLKDFLIKLDRFFVVVLLFITSIFLTIMPLSIRTFSLLHMLQGYNRNSILHISIPMYYYAILILYRLASLPWKVPPKATPAKPIIHRPRGTKPKQKLSTMPRPRPDMTITVNPRVQQTFLLSPTPTTTTFHINPPTLPHLPSSPTFLLSPTPSLSQTRFRISSPILPPSHTRRISTPTSTLPAYPTPRSLYNNSPPSPPLLPSPSSHTSDLSTAQTAVERTPAPQTTRMSDILPDDMDLYIDDGNEDEAAEETPDTRIWTIALTDGAQEAVTQQGGLAGQTGGTEQVERVSTDVEEEEEEVWELEMGQEVKGSLPVIKEHEYAYYPRPLYSASEGRERKDEDIGRMLARKLVKKRRGGSGVKDGMRGLLRKVFRRKGKGKGKGKTGMDL